MRLACKTRRAELGQVGQPAHEVFGAGEVGISMPGGLEGSPVACFAVAFAIAGRLASSQGFAWLQSPWVWSL